MTAEPRCLARQFSDQMHCQACRLTWDMNDEDAARMCPRTARSAPLIVAPRLPFASGLPDDPRYAILRK